MALRPAAGACPAGSAPAGSVRAAASSASARAVGWATTSRSVTPSSLAASRIAASEWPPRSKNPAVTETVSAGRLRISANAATIADSTGFAGGSTAAGFRSASGRRLSAARSTFPFRVTGKLSSRSKTSGSMYRGSIRASAADSSWGAGSAVPVYQAASRSRPPSPRTSATAWSTPGTAASAPSTSLSSILKPRSFVWWSRRPAQSSTPPGSQRPMSPVR